MRGFRRHEAVVRAGPQSNPHSSTRLKYCLWASLRHLARKAAPLKSVLFPIVLAIGVSIDAPPASAYLCRSNSILSQCQSDVIQHTALPGAMDGTSGIESWSAGQPCPTGCYDLVQGRLEASGIASVYGPCGSSVEASDDYNLVGPGSDARHAFEAVLQVDATITGSGVVFARLQSGDGASVEVELTASELRELVLPVIVDFYDLLLTVSLRAAGVNPTPEGTSKGVATLRFRGLPPNISVLSCQRYALPVPAAVASWGSVKAMYR